MPVATLEGLFSSPAFICIFLAILTCVANVLIGVNIIPKDKRKKGYKLHGWVYGVVMVWYAAFLAYNERLSENAWFEYFVFFYLLTAVPWSKRVNVTLHAVIASTGLVLLVLAATLSIL